MAIVYDNNINKHTDWDGDLSTFGKPVSGRAVLEFIKRSLNSKIGYIYEDTRLGKYLGFADEEDYNKWIEEGSFLFSNLIIQTWNSSKVETDKLDKQKLGYVYEDHAHGRFLGFSNEQSYHLWEQEGRNLNSNLIISQWNNSKEQGLPIYTKEYADSLVDVDPNSYIVIPDESDVTNSEVENKTYDTSINGPLANILFSAIRQLQSEIAKIKNTFDYGLYSYTGTNTAMSRVEHGYEEDVEDEPLWAIEEDGSLSFLTEIPVDNLHGITPLENVFIENQTLRIEGLGTWEILQELGDDPKLLIYLTTTGKNISFNLIDEEENTFILNLNELNIPSVNIYNILVIISRKKQEFGNNYIWISVEDFNSNNTLLNGYYKNGELIPSLNSLDNSYNLQGITFNNLILSKCNVYSKYQDFSLKVIPSKPEDVNNYSYKVAHITIRSVNSYDTLNSIKDLLPENELIFVENIKKLYIKNNYRLIPLVGNSQEPIDDGMTKEEIIQLLEELGIVSLDNGQLSINSLSDITFIHEDSGTEFKLNIDSEGNLHTTKIEDETLSDIILNTFGTDSIGSEDNIRGFVGRLRKAQRNEEIRGTSIKEYAETDNIGLCSDRIKIGAFYAPALNNKSFGCSHCFIELENTSDRDFPLEGCYIHLARNNSNNLPIVSHLALTGTIPAGGTYLIRGAKKAEFDDPNTFIKVTTFDLEWWENGLLLDFSHNGIIIENNEGKTVGNDPHGICLTYGKEDLGAMETISSFNEDTTTLKKAEYIYKNYYIDSIYYNSAYKSGTSYPWAAGKDVLMAYISSTNKNFPDCIYRNAFELDPANLAYQALNTYDSSRYRHQTKNDYQYLELSKEFIEFPKTSEKYPISKFTPKASFEHKNVCTDKTQLNINKPNNVTCSFGKNPYTTRCFNWVSGGLFDEYVFIKQGNTWKKFESYKEGDESTTQAEGEYPKRKEFNNADIINCIYKRITGKFPAANTVYTAHKCIIDIINPQSSSVQSPTTYTYIVGRADKNENPDFEHCSEEYTFTLYPTSYTPRIYQTTDQQGFHWVEYQSWGAAAEYINTRINNETSSENIIPVLVNTGDMTLSGSRVNEWIDYYNAGKSLFKHLELMNVVGNNDLCGNDLTILGTGDDAGKSNSYYFHVFYCYEVETEEGLIPIINNKYVPSLYRIIFNDYILLFVNSEITANNCIGWFNKSFIDTTGKTCPINIYTGWEVPTEGEAHYDGSFTSIYTMIYNMTDINNKEIIALCHEMPFTVITLENLYPQSDITPKYRNVSGTSLVGSHLNLLNPNDKVGIYWFSRLLEYRGCKLCIGGHKHTYAITYPLMENYLYGNNLSSLHDGPMSMFPTLENDSVTWITKNTGDYLFIDNLPDWDINLSKFPLTKRTDPTGDSGYAFYPSKNISPETGFVNGNSGVIYFMCLATGFKLMSNKELPSPKQTFSQFLPNSVLEFDSNGKVSSSTASLELRYPMFSIIDLNNNINIKLIRLKNILNRPQDLFTLITHGKSNIVPLYLIPSNSNNLNEWQYGIWSDTEENLLSNI